MRGPTAGTDPGRRCLNYLNADHSNTCTMVYPPTSVSWDHYWQLIFFGWFSCGFRREFKIWMNEYKINAEYISSIFIDLCLNWTTFSLKKNQKILSFTWLLSDFLRRFHLFFHHRMSPAIWRWRWGTSDWHREVTSTWKGPLTRLWGGNDVNVTIDMMYNIFSIKVRK